MIEEQGDYRKCEECGRIIPACQKYCRACENKIKDEKNNINISNNLN